MCTTLNGFSKEWHTFVQVIFGRDTLLGWECLWNDFTQEKLRLSFAEVIINSSGKGSKVEKEEENEALAGKGKAKKVPSQGRNLKGEKKKVCRRSSASGVSNLVTTSPSVQRKRTRRGNNNPQLRQRLMS